VGPKLVRVVAATGDAIHRRHVLAGLALCFIHLLIFNLAEAHAVSYVGWNGMKRVSGGDLNDTRYHADSASS
jgi:hypothetical protein